MSASTSPRSGRGLKVLHVMESTIGGTRRHLTDIARGLNARGVEVHLVVAAERQTDFRADLARLADEGCVVTELPMVRAISPLRDPRHLLALERIMRRVRPDIVHTHSSKAGVLGRLASIAGDTGIRVHTPHTLAFLFQEMFGKLKRGLFFQLEKHLAGHTRRVVAVSESEARTFVESGVIARNRVRVVPNGIDPTPYEDAAPLDLAGLGLDPARPTAAVIGLLNAAKGQDLALEALARPEAWELQLVVAGHGELDEELERRANELGVRGRVAFLGYRTDVPAILAACDLLLLPSRWEGLPYVVLEAMAAGKPVVATPVDGAVDLLSTGETGWLAERIDGEALAAALGAFLDLSPEVRKAFGRRGRERVRERYTVERMVEGLLDLYAELQ